MSRIKADLKRAADPWRWMILLSRFFVTFFLVGNFKAMGVFLPHIESGFDTNTASAGFVIGSSLGFGFICIGPFLGIVKAVWSARRITIVGGCISAMGILAATFSPSIVPFATFILISSVGGGIVDFAVIQPLLDYFPEDFAMANGASLAGGPVGMMVVPPTMEYLLSVYGWNAALGLLRRYPLTL
ncbi:monocarboxylate transporter 14-like [Asterias amurensis]|uniref:monocarboxylate transporter 14-like n=1 Tax=Asterias amurensis TaxID=7602 RepID=UPI003AB8164B